MPVVKVSNPKPVVAVMRLAPMKCYVCGDNYTTLIRVKGEDGNKLVPAKYICKDCSK